MEPIRCFFESGKGVFIWGDNEGFYADANYLAGRLLGPGAMMSGNIEACRILEKVERPADGGFVDHPITTGIERLYEGITVATIHPHDDLQPLLYATKTEWKSALPQRSNIIASCYDKDGKRLLIDSGYTKLDDRCFDGLQRRFLDEAPGVSRYVKNAAVWLANCERHQAALSSASQSSTGASQSGASQPTAQNPATQTCRSTQRKSLVLTGDNGTQLVFNIETGVGKNLLKGCGDEARFFGEQQFTLRPMADGEWELSPNRSSTNDSLVNGAAITTAVKLKAGDTISVGRKSKGISKLPLRVSFR